MTDTLISLDTAKLAYEKGFVEYQGKRGYYRLSDGREVLFWIMGKMDYEFLGYAPTQSVLQRWLREVHHKLLYVEHSYGEWVFVVEYASGYYEQKDASEDQTFEEALEAGLKYSLELL